MKRAACCHCAGTDEAQLCAAGQCRWEWEHEHERRSGYAANPAHVLRAVAEELAPQLGLEVDHAGFDAMAAYCDAPSGGVEGGQVWPPLAYRRANPLPVKEEP